jgi:nucleotide-binding universal stress UspA family protein
MFKRILVPLDRSKRAERAIPLAARLAHAAGGTVILVHVVNVGIDVWSSLAPAPLVRQDLIDLEMKEAMRYLTEAASTVDLDGIATERVALIGSTASTILSVADSHHADLIVISSHGYSGITRWALGSVAEKVIHHASIPVLVLHEGGAVPGGALAHAARSLRVLVPLDGSAYAKAALEPAAQVVAALSAPLPGIVHLIRVAKPMESRAVSAEDKGDEQENLPYKARHYLSATAAHLGEGLIVPAVAKLNIRINWALAVSAEVAPAIVREAEDGMSMFESEGLEACDLIAMATHGRGGLQRLALGSVTEQVLHTTRLPMLIIRSPNIGNTTQQQGKKTANVAHSATGKE